MCNEALVVAFYESARNELISRIQMRDQALIAYIVGMGALLSFIITSKEVHDSDVISFGTAFALPIFCLCFTLVVLQHSVVIGALSHYVSIDLLGDHTVPVHWDCSPTLFEGAEFQWQRIVAQISVLALPSAYGLYFSYAQSGEGHFWLCAILALYDVAMIGWIVSLHVAGARRRASFTSRKRSIGNSDMNRRIG